MPHLFRRLGSGLLTLWVVITLTFLLMRLLPGSPFNDPKVPASVQAILEARFLLNEPLWVQYGHYMAGLLRGDLGPSMVSEGRSVVTMVLEATQVSATLGLLALIAGSALGIVLGTLAGLSRRPAVDAGLSVLGLVALSTPSFVLGGVLVLLFSFGLGWLPAAMLTTPAHYVLPVTALAATPFAFTFMLIRTAVMDTRLQPYVRVKQAFGIPPLRIAVAHVLRNSLLPLLSLFGPLAAGVLTGSFAVEYLFALPGLGKYFVNAVNTRDYTLLMGITLVYSALLIGLNLLTDVLYTVVDPRLRESTQ